MRLVMRFTVIFLILTSFLVSSSISLAGGYKSERSGRKGYLKKDRFDSDRTNIYDRNGSRKGYLKKDRFLKRDESYVQHLFFLL